MWIVAKIKHNQYSIFKDSLSKLIKDKTEIYFPKMSLQKNKKNIVRNLLGTYIFCFNENFNKKDIKSFQHLKGLNYFLDNSFGNQKDIRNFILFCKSFENKQGILNSNFFLNLRSKNLQFINGPLKNLFFKILQVDKNKIFAEVNNNKKIIINKENCHQFLSN